MTDEPILCFDGDGAGRRAAYRAVDLALPRLKPGKSLRFALLPEGQDPDDLVRSGGRAAVAEVLGSARGLADMLWVRETEAATFDTPERRAALEKRMNELAASIGDDAVRKYYRQDLETRLQGMFSPSVPSNAGRNTQRRWPPTDRWPRRGGRFAAPQTAAREALAPLSARLGTSPIVRGFRSALPPREALMLLGVINHPWLIDDHAEEFAELEFLNPDADQLRRAILDAGHGHAVPDSAALRAALEARGLGPVLARVDSALTHASDWPARSGVDPRDVAQWWAHVVTLHRKHRTLNRELKDAERALGEEPTDANLAWLRDVQGRLSALDGSEALIEGFGALSGRTARSL
jgi:DNA primase